MHSKSIEQEGSRTLCMLNHAGKPSFAGSDWLMILGDRQGFPAELQEGVPLQLQETTGAPFFCNVKYES